MRRSVAAILLAGLLVLAGRSAWPADAQTGGCQLAPVFVMLRELVGRDRVGECVGPVVRNDAGELSQQTALGMMTFRPSDMVTLFSDGNTAWLYGPRGLESRPSSSRLAWETGAATTTTTTTTGSGTGAATTGNQTTGNTTTGAGPGASTTTGAGATGSTASPWPPNNTSANPTGANTTGANTTGVSSVSSASAGAPPTLPPVVRSTLPIEVDGSTSSTSGPFDLAGGDYRVTWEIERERGAASCYVGARLRRFESNTPGTLALHTTLNTSNDSTSSGESRLFAVQPGRYVLDITTTGCSWKIGLHAPR